MTNSPMLPELPVPALPEKMMVTGLADQTAFGAVSEAKPTIE